MGSWERVGRWVGERGWNFGGGAEWKRRGWDGGWFGRGGTVGVWEGVGTMGDWEGMLSLIHI